MRKEGGHDNGSQSKLARGSRLHGAMGRFRCHWRGGAWLGRVAGGRFRREPRPHRPARTGGRRRCAEHDRTAQRAGEAALPALRPRPGSGRAGRADRSPPGPPHRPRQEARTAERGNPRGGDLSARCRWPCHCRQQLAQARQPGRQRLQIPLLFPPRPARRGRRVFRPRHADAPAGPLYLAARARHRYGAGRHRRQGSVRSGRSANGSDRAPMPMSPTRRASSSSPAIPNGISCAMSPSTRGKPPRSAPAANSARRRSIRCRSTCCGEGNPDGDLVRLGRAERMYLAAGGPDPDHRLAACMFCCRPKRS